MSNYPTSGKKPSYAIKRYVVTYEEDIPGGRILTFGVTASLSSEATAKVIEFIRVNKMHQSDHPYILIPRVSKDKTDYNVNLYLNLYHGRTDPNKDMDGEWGTNGPIIGPIQLSHTYGLIKIHDKDWDEFSHLNMYEGMVFFDGVYYGDFEIMTEETELIAKARYDKDRVFLTYEEAKKIIEKEIKK